jgi:SAM-dependent methyltransferase
MTSSTTSTHLGPSYGDFMKGIALRQDNEYERLRLQHKLHKNSMSGELVQVPLSKTESVKILDSATGDGTWMVDVANQYPKAEFVGTDLFAKHFEQLKDLPPSITFKVQSVLDEWPAEDANKYDLVHQRYCLAQFSAEKDLGIIQRLFGLVKPGGYLQIVDANLGGFDSGDEHPGMTEAMNYFVRAFTEAGLEPKPGPRAAKWFEEVGAVNVKEQVLSFPVGVKAADLDDQTSTTVNLCNIIDNFAAIGASKKSWVVCLRAKADSLLQGIQSIGTRQTTLKLAIRELLRRWRRRGILGVSG